jgi:hypothetical protein
MQERISQDTWRIFFYSGWTLLAFILSGSAELIDDEAYYWVCSKHLDVGYYFQPPVSAWLIRLGTVFSESEWGVRLFFTLMSTASIYFLERIIRPKNWRLFILLVASIALLHVAGVMAVPDVPLFFFAALWIWKLRSYLEEPTFRKSIFLGLVAALLIYSKYHGLMLLGLCLLPNLRLLKEWTFYALVGFALILLLPHVLWLVKMDYQPLKFHLFHRGERGFDFVNVAFYVGGQLLLFGPLVGIILFGAAVKLKARDAFERMLKFCFYGVFGFLFLLSLRGQVEANWSVIALIPLLYFGYRWIDENEVPRRWFRALLIPSLVIGFGARVFVMWDVMPESLGLNPEFVGSEEWAEQLSSVAKDRPVIFMSNYQDASKYHYYSGKPSFSLGFDGGHGSDYDNWGKMLEDLQGQDVLFVLRWKDDWADSVQAGSRMMYTKSIENFRSFGTIRFSVDLDDRTLSRRDKNFVTITIANDGPMPAFNSSEEYTPYWCFSWRKDGKLVERRTSWVSVEYVWKQGKFNLPLIMPKLPGDYVLEVGIQTAWMPPYVEQGVFEVTVE